MKRSLLEAYPDVAAEWHPTRNAPLTPGDVAPYCHKKIWWLCVQHHEWETSVSNRSSGRGCPFCRGQKATAENNLAVMAPHLAAEWHPTKNGTLAMLDLTPQSNRKVWWRCSEGHEWETRVYYRTKDPVGCPFCSGRYASEDNNLAKKAPHLIGEWHSTKNGNLTPHNVTPQSNKKIWWRCKRGHEWRAEVYSRFRGSGCPKCSPQTTRPELRIYSEIQHIFPDVQHRIRVEGIECDILLPSVRIAVMYDGYYYHKNEVALVRDTRRTKTLNDLGYQVIRLRDHVLPAVGCTVRPDGRRDLSLSTLKDLLRELDGLLAVEHPAHSAISHYLERETFIQEDFLELVGVHIERERSLAVTHPEIAAEWHSTKNGGLTPYDVSRGSNLQVWWKCQAQHEWRASPNGRTAKSTGCPFCTNRRVNETNNFAVLYPDLLASWHPTKNGDLDPTTLTGGSVRKVWWMCEAGHEWCAKIYSRTRMGTGCPICCWRVRSRNGGSKAVHASRPAGSACTEPNSTGT